VTGGPAGALGHAGGKHCFIEKHKKHIFFFFFDKFVDIEQYSRQNALVDPWNCLVPRRLICKPTLP
jgi:hypothetical protein